MKSISTHLVNWFNKSLTAIRAEALGEDVDHPIIRRALAYVIDYLILAVPTGIAFLLTKETNGNAGFLPYTLAATLVYFTISASKNASGRSFGKRIFRIQVVNEDGEFLGIAQALLRGIPVVIVTHFPSIVLWAKHRYEPDNAMGNVISLAIMFLLVGTPYFALLKLNRQSLHDLIASTQVVELGSVVKTKKNLTTPLVLGFIALFSAVICLLYTR